MRKYIELLRKIVDDNPDKVEEINKMIDNIRIYNSGCEDRNDIKEIPYKYINGKDELLIQKFVYSSKKVIRSIEFLENNKISLLENENLTFYQFSILADIKEGVAVASYQYRYGIDDGNTMMSAFKNDLYRDWCRLGYQRYNEVKFCGYEEDREMSFALMRVNLSDKKEIFGLRLQGILDLIFKL